MAAGEPGSDWHLPSNSNHGFQSPFILTVQEDQKKDVDGLGCLGAVHVQRWSLKHRAKSAVAAALSLSFSCGCIAGSRPPRKAVGYDIDVYSNLPQGPQHTDWHLAIQTVTIQKTNLLLPHRSQVESEISQMHCVNNGCAMPGSS